MPRNKKARQDRLKSMLRDKREQLWSELRGEIFERLADDYKTEFDRAMDSADKSVLDVLQTVGLKLVDIRQSELAEMAEAERRLEEGTYGICAECGQEIREERLAAVPFAVHCIACAERFEKEPVHGKGPTM